MATNDHYYVVEDCEDPGYETDSYEDAVEYLQQLRKQGAKDPVILLPRNHEGCQLFKQLEETI